MRLSGRSLVVLGAVIGLVVVFTTDQVVPASSEYQAGMRVWLAGRATGIVAYLLLTVLVTLGLVLAHPTNKSAWHQSRRILPWHESLFVFVVAFLAAHVVSLAIDPYAGVGVGGALVPGLSEYRSAPVALGTLGLYATLVTGVSARWTRLLPSGLWLRLHRLAGVAWALGWLHGLTAGTDSGSLLGVYVLTGALVLGAGAHRYWVVKRARVIAARSVAGGATRPVTHVSTGGPIVPPMPRSEEAA
jgi:predicted ferric reductase